MLPTLLSLLAELAGLAGVALVHEVGTRSGGGGLVASRQRPGPVPLPLTQSPLPVAPDDCWPMDEPFEFELSLRVSVASANAAVVSSEKAAAKIIFFMMFNVLSYSARTIPCRLTDRKKAKALIALRCQFFAFAA